MSPQIMPGAASLGGASFLEVMYEQAKINQDYAEVAAKNIEAARNSAEAAGTAAVTSANQQASATQSTAIGSIIAGGVPIAAGFASKVSQWKSGVNDDLKNIDTKIGNVKSFNNQLTDIAEAKVEVAPSGVSISKAPSANATSIKNGSFDFERNTASDADIEMVDRTDRKVSYDKSVDTLKALRDERQGLQGQLSEIQQFWNQGVAQVGQAAAQGGGQMASVAHTIAVGQAEQQKILANYGLESLNGLIKTQLDQGSAAMQRESTAAQAASQAGGLDSGR